MSAQGLPGVATTGARCCGSSPRSRRGRTEVTAPVYSHLIYDIVPEARAVVHRPDILLLEGLNVLPAAPVGCPAGGRRSR